MVQQKSSFNLAIFPLQIGLSLETNPANGNYYFSMFKTDLLKTEPFVFERIVQKKDIRSLDEQLKNLTTNYDIAMVT